MSSQQNDLSWISLILTIAIGIWIAQMSGCMRLDEVKYYPIVCPVTPTYSYSDAVLRTSDKPPEMLELDGCKAVTGIDAAFRVSTESQRVIVGQDNGFLYEELNNCIVWDRKNWHCDGGLIYPFWYLGQEKLHMRNGVLLNSLRKHDFEVRSMPRRSWWIRRLKNDSIKEFDVLTSFSS